MAAEISLRTTAPEPPPADFAFEIDFKYGEGSPSRVFLAINDFIRGCEKLDAELAQTIDSNIETVLVLEDIEAGSIKVWLRNALRATEDDALKKLDWKPLVGKYLVRAKYVVLRWLDEEATVDKKSLLTLARSLQAIAAETDVKYLPDYQPPPPKALIEAARDFEAVKSHLSSGDRAFYVPRDGAPLELNLSVRWDVEDIEAMAVKETVMFPAAQMILAVKKPDYLGDSKWDLRHGRRSISARIEDHSWLRRFQSREVDVRPGDSLRCEVQIENLYGFDNELLSERYTVTRVLEVLENRYHQIDFLRDDENGG
jgi:hypothetical protein